MPETGLTATEVGEIITDCLFKDDELPAPGQPPAGAVMVAMITTRFGFHPERLATHKDRILELLHMLPPQFQKDKGGGWSFLNACNDIHGHQWGEHKDMEALFALGLATGQVKELMPREEWDTLPGGMPYYVIE